MNGSLFPMFLVKTLNGAFYSPDTAFKSEPDTPTDNLFKVGQKIEAVDKKNPHLICVATIGNCFYYYFNYYLSLIYLK